MKRFLVATGLLLLLAGEGRSQAPVLDQPAGQSVCNGSKSTPLSFTSNNTATVYTWTNSDPSIGLPASGTGPLPAFVAQNPGGTDRVATIEVTPSVNQGGTVQSGTAKTFTITVKPTARVDALPNQTLCAGTMLAPIMFSGNIPGGAYTWTNDNTGTGLAASGTGDIASFTVQNNDKLPMVSVVTVRPQDNGCPVKTAVFRLQVKPAPTMDAPADQVLCAGDTTSVAGFFSAVPGTVFSWTNSNPEIGIGALGTGNIPAFRARNNTAAEIQGAFQVTPRAGGCSGATHAFTYRVRPNAGSISYTGSPFCPVGPAYVTADGSRGGTFSAAPAGLDIDAATGALNLAYSQPGIYTVSYAVAGAGSCQATATTQVRVKAPATVGGAQNQVLWTGTATQQITFTGSAANYTWTNSNTATGLAASGSGSTIPSFVATNTGNELAESVIHVTPEGDGFNTCTGKALVFRIRVKPMPSAAAVTNQEFCTGRMVTPPSFAGPLAGTQFTWVNNNPEIGLPASGTGDLPSFLTVNNTATARVATITVTPSVNDHGHVYTGGPMTFNITVNPTPEARISYAGGALCTSSGVVSVSRTGTAGGTYTAAPDGLSIDPSTGAIDPAASTPGTYTVTYRIAAAGGCDEVSATASVQVDAPLSAALSYSGSPYCTNTGSIAASRTGAAGGTYSATPAGLSLDAASGSIDLAASAPGVYTITYSFGQGTGCPRTVSTQVSVMPGQLLTGVPNRVLCAGTTSAAIAFNGQPGLSYVWSNDNTAIGLAASGTTDIAAFTAQNNTGTPQTANVKVTPVGGTGCVNKFMTFRITVNPAPAVNAVSSQVLCAGSSTAAVAFSGTGGTTFKWVNDNTSIGLGAVGTTGLPAFEALNNSGSTQVANITVTPLANGCTGTPQTFSLTVHPSAGAIAYPGSPYCLSGTANVQRSGSLGGTFSATPAGLNISSSSGVLNLGLSQPGTYTVSYAPTATGGSCAATATTTVVVNPAATFDGLPNMVLCAGTTVSALAFTGTAGSYTWTNSNPAIGLAASGSGSGIASFVATNTTAVAQAGLIHVTPLGDGSGTCDGKTQVFRILVNPQPTVDAVADQVYCRNSGTGALAFTSPVSGSTFTWTNSNPAIGLAASGTGSIPSFVTQNGTASPLAATITVTPKANKCTGTPLTFQYIVNDCITRKAGVEAEGTERAMAVTALSVGPNPTRNFVDVRIGGTQRRLELQVLDASGKPVLPLQRGAGNRFRVELQGLPAGVYLLRVTDPVAGTAMTQRIVRQ